MRDGAGVGEVHDAGQLALQGSRGTQVSSTGWSAHGQGVTVACKQPATGGTMRRSCRLATLQARTPSPCAPHVYPLTLAISMLMGSSSGSTVMELGMSTTLSYLGSA